MKKAGKKIREEMSCAGAGAEKNIRNVIFRRMKARQRKIARPYVEKPEARHKLSSAYGMPEI